MEHARLISIAKLNTKSKVIHKFGKDRQLTLVLHGLFEGAQYNSDAGASALSIQGREQNKGAE